jgi:hypothetical protein
MRIDHFGDARILGHQLHIDAFLRFGHDLRSNVIHIVSLRITQCQQFHYAVGQNPAIFFLANDGKQSRDTSAFVPKSEVTTC